MTGAPVCQVGQSDGMYPKRLLSVLGEEAPETLYLQGNTSLLGLNGIGFCGTRRPSQKGFDTVRDYAKRVAKKSGFIVIAGNAAGVDLEAHYHAFLAGGSTILVLPEGIKHLRIKRALKPVWDWKRVLVISQFDPGTSWNLFHATAHNQVIIGLSKAVIAIEAEEKGEAVYAGMEALRLKRKLHVVKYQDMSVSGRGNKKLLGLGGKHLLKTIFSKQSEKQNTCADIGWRLEMASVATQKKFLFGLVLGCDGKKLLKDEEDFIGKDLTEQPSDKEPQRTRSETPQKPESKRVTKTGCSGRKDASVGLVLGRDGKKLSKDEEESVGKDLTGQPSDNKPQRACLEMPHTPEPKGVPKTDYSGRMDASVDLVLKRGSKWLLKYARSIWGNITGQPSVDKPQRTRPETPHAPEPNGETKTQYPEGMDASVDSVSERSGKGLLKDVEPIGGNIIGQPSEKKPQRARPETPHPSEPKGVAKTQYPGGMDASVDSVSERSGKGLLKDVEPIGGNIIGQPSVKKPQRARFETPHTLEPKRTAETRYSRRMETPINSYPRRGSKGLSRDEEFFGGNIIGQPSEKKSQRTRLETPYTPEANRIAEARYFEGTDAPIDSYQGRSSKKLLRDEGFFGGNIVGQPSDIKPHQARPETPNAPEANRMAETRYFEGTGASIDSYPRRGGMETPSGTRMERITKESVEQMRENTEKSICFETTHKSQPRETPCADYFGRINIPFGAGFKRIFPFELFPDRVRKDAYWKIIRDEAEFDEIDAWLKHQGSRVFLHDCLYTSVALSPNFKHANRDERTRIGALEYHAKWHSDLGATRELAEHCVNTIEDLPRYATADFVCAVPPTPGKGLGLPFKVAKIVGDSLGKDNITGNFHFRAEKKSLADIRLDDRWPALDEAQLSFDGVDVSGKRIILIDDMYQSGTTMQYSAMKLQEAGAYQVCGLCMVKSRGDRDNQQSRDGL